MANLKAPCILEAGSQLHKHETFYTNVSIAKQSWLPFPAVDPIKPRTFHKFSSQPSLMTPEGETTFS